MILSKHVGQQGARHVAVVPAGWVREGVLETHPHQVVVCPYSGLSMDPLGASAGAPHHQPV